MRDGTRIAARIAALNAAMLLRTGLSSPESIINQADAFDRWIMGAGEGNAGIPIPGSADGAKASGEASAEG